MKRKTRLFTGIYGLLYRMCHTSQGSIALNSLLIGKSWLCSDYSTSLSTKPGHEKEGAIETNSHSSVSCKSLLIISVFHWLNAFSVSTKALLRKRKLTGGSNTPPPPPISSLPLGIWRSIEEFKREVNEDFPAAQQHHFCWDWCIQIITLNQ